MFHFHTVLSQVVTRQTDSTGFTPFRSCDRANCRSALDLDVLAFILYSLVLFPTLYPVTTIVYNNSSNNDDNMFREQLDTTVMKHATPSLLIIKAAPIGLYLLACIFSCAVYCPVLIFPKITSNNVILYTCSCV